MATEKRVWDIIKEAGFAPVENRGIIVKYAPENLSQKLKDFFSMEFYVLQMCKDEIVLVPFSAFTLALKKEVALEIPYSTIRSITVEEDLLNYRILVEMDSDRITLSTQQKELSDFRSSGFLSYESKGLKLWNWHKGNFDATMEALKSLANN